MSSHSGLSIVGSRCVLYEDDANCSGRKASETLIEIGGITVDKYDGRQHANSREYARRKQREILYSPPETLETQLLNRERYQDMISDTSNSDMLLQIKSSGEAALAQRTHRCPSLKFALEIRPKLRWSPVPELSVLCRMVHCSSILVDYILENDITKPSVLAELQQERFSCLVQKNSWLRVGDDLHHVFSEVFDMVCGLHEQQISTSPVREDLPTGGNALLLDPSHPLHELYVSTCSKSVTMCGMITDEELRTKRHKPDETTSMGLSLGYDDDDDDEP